jgi:Zinc dependent phospholipase C
MHLAFAQRMAADNALPMDVQTLIQTEPGAFLLGNIAPDARVSSGIRRADTHFFEYMPKVDPSPVTTMLTRFPELCRSVVTSPAFAAFLMGYTAHLAMDLVWCEQLLFPQFMHGWPDDTLSFHMLHMLLAHLDERDYQLLNRAVQYPALAQATPDNWLPFMPDSALIDWRDLIAEQVAPTGKSLTTTILGQRIKMNGSEMQAFLDDPAKMDASLWHNLPRAIVEQVEAAMNSQARETMISYSQT